MSAQRHHAQPTGAAATEPALCFQSDGDSKLITDPVLGCPPPQKYRHVDNIMFENHTIADRFLDFWRKTGSQRMGYLYGRFTEHKDIPLGIRAEVAAIYEPPQVNRLLLTKFTDGLIP